MKRILAGLLMLSAFCLSPAFAADEASVAPAQPPGPPTVLVPVKNWFAPSQPIEIKVSADGPVTLTMTDFTGGKVEAKEGADVEAAGTKNLRKVFPMQMEAAGTYLLYAVPKGKELKDFVGTPLVVGVRGDTRQFGPQGPIVVKVEPLRFLVMTTSKGPITMAFYYDVAPNTAHNFLSLAAHGFYNGLTFHRIVPGFVIQGGDPRGDGMGGPGYQIQAEFNDRPHHEGVLSMARSRDPNSAGSQFFVCLDYKQTAQLDKQYTAFGRVTSGMDAVKAIAATPTGAEDRPKETQKIEKVEVKNVTAAENPYPELQKLLTTK